MANKFLFLVLISLSLFLLTGCSQEKSEQIDQDDEVIYYKMNYVPTNISLAENVLTLGDLETNDFLVVPKNTRIIEKSELSEESLRKGWQNGYMYFLGNDEIMLSGTISLYNTKEYFGKITEDDVKKGLNTNEWDFTILGDKLNVGEDSSLISILTNEEFNIVELNAIYYYNNVKLKTSIGYWSDYSYKSTGELLEILKLYSKRQIDKLKSIQIEVSLNENEKICANGIIINRTDLCDILQFNEQEHQKALEHSEKKQHAIIKQYTLIPPSSDFSSPKIVGIFENDGDKTINELIIYIKLYDSMDNLIGVDEINYYDKIAPTEEIPFERSLYGNKNTNRVEFDIKIID